MNRADRQKRPDEVAGMFDGVAAGYERSNVLLSIGNSTLWRLATVRALAAKPRERILDVAAGTGALSAALARGGAHVTALDFSAGMVERGKRDHPEVEFVHGDAERLPFSDAEFDAVSISFGLRNIRDPKLALSEMFRVLKPGGRLIVCEFSHPPRALMRLGYEAWVRVAMPVVAALASTNPAAYRYLLESIQEWPDQHKLSQWIRSAGFIRVAHRNLSGGVVALHRGKKPVATSVNNKKSEK